MPSEVPTSTMSNAAAPAHTRTTPAVASNRTRPEGIPGPARGPAPGAKRHRFDPLAVLDDLLSDVGLSRADGWRRVVRWPGSHPARCALMPQ